jgi:hypothetical protein
MRAASAKTIGVGGPGAIRRGDPKLSPVREQSLASSSPTGDSVLGVHVPADVEHGALLATLILLAGTLLIVFLIADDAGIGPRHRRWRAYWSERLTRR